MYPVYVYGTIKIPTYTYVHVYVLLHTYSVNRRTSVQYNAPPFVSFHNNRTYAAGGSSRIDERFAHNYVEVPPVSNVTATKISFLSSCDARPKL